jgi:hypothetical protein
MVWGGAWWRGRSELEVAGTGSVGGTLPRGLGRAPTGAGGEQGEAGLVG